MHRAWCDARNRRSGTRSPPVRDCGKSTKRPTRSPRAIRLGSSSPNEQIDLLGLLDVGVQRCLRVDGPPNRPTRLKYDGRDCFVYRVELPAEHGPRAGRGVRRRCQQPVGRHRRAGPPIAPRNGKLPLAELNLIATNVAVDDDKFVVAKSLTEDGRIGKVSDAQGVVVLRPMLAKRWTPVCRETLLKPGDWLRTESARGKRGQGHAFVRGRAHAGAGNAGRVHFAHAGPLHSGQVQVMHPAQKDAETARHSNCWPRARGAASFKPGDKQLVRVDRDEKLVDVPQTPVWLAGFEGTSNNESLGSLIVNLPDGRNEPLTVGYHKVSVDIRDQIARTTIEESFVNHTDARLEGVFHFPLPQDASISGFGMWIGNDLVEADVVEKQRAREIYETILREKRDPGLLEWTGGNIFKARVFPIEADSEKRIKIIYTQVLPLRAQPVSLHLRPAERAAAHEPAARAVAERDGELGGAAQERHLPDALGPHAADGPLGPRRVRRAGVHARSRLRGGVRNRRPAIGRRRHPASPRRRRLLPHATHAPRARRELAARAAARRQAAEPRAAVRHVGLDGLGEAQAAGRVRGDACSRRSGRKTGFLLACADVEPAWASTGTNGSPTPKTSPRRTRFWTSGCRSAGRIWTGL